MLSPNLGMKTELAESGRLSDAAFASFFGGVDHADYLACEVGVCGALFGSVFDLPRHEFSELVVAQLRGCEPFRISTVVTGLNCGVVNENPLVGVGAFVIGHHLPRSPNR